MMQRSISVISFKIFWKKPYRNVISKKISGLQNHQTAILWIITSEIRLRRKYMRTDKTPLLKVKKRWFQKQNRFGRNAPQTWLKFENLWKNFPAGLVQSKNAMGPPSKCTLDNILLDFFIHYFITVFTISINYSFSLVWICFIVQNFLLFPGRYFWR